MKRKVLAWMLALALLAGLCPLAGAAAVMGPDETLEAAQTLYSLGLFQGVGTLETGAPDFALDHTATREQAIAMLVRLLGREDKALAGSWELPFDDVSDWARPYVGLAYAEGLTTGKSRNGVLLFDGGGTVTATEYLTFVLRAMGYASGEDFAWDSAWTLSDSLGITQAGQYPSGEPFLRGEVACISRNALYALCKDGETSLGSALGLILPGASALTVRFFDVGQADCILAESEGHYMLIDAGNDADEAEILAALTALGVEKLDYVVGTHPHEDHIGSLDAVIRHFEVDTVLMPEKSHSTRTFLDVLDAVEEKGLKLTAPELGARYALGSATFTILSPRRDYGEELNNWSIGIRLCCGDMEFVLCGDAEEAAEADMVSSGLTLRADVLKLGHHGSDTSTTEAFLDAVAPSCAVLSCGRDNEYGHPAAQTLERLEARGITLYRTDEQGTIVCATDGHTLSWLTYPEPETAQEEADAA